MDGRDKYIRDVKLITKNQKELIDDMNEFCHEKFMYDDSTTSAQASKYINRNIEEFKLFTMDSWQLQYI